MFLSAFLSLSLSSSVSSRCVFMPVNEWAHEGERERKCERERVWVWTSKCSKTAYRYRNFHFASKWQPIFVLWIGSIYSFSVAVPTHYTIPNQFDEHSLGAVIQTTYIVIFNDILCFYTVKWNFESAKSISFSVLSKVICWDKWISSAK